MLLSPGCGCCGPTGTPYRVRVLWCGQPLSDAVVRIYTSSGMGVLLGEATSGVDGYATVYLSEGGSRYAYVVSPHPRIASAGATVMLSPSTPPTVTLSAAPGYTCCYLDYCPSPVPRGQLLATTSGGESWTLAGCTSDVCVQTDVIPIGPAHVTSSIARPGFPGDPPCPYNDFPTITPGRTTCRVVITRVGTIWRAGLVIPPSYGVSKWEPMKWEYCVLWEPGLGYEFRRWYSSESGCSGSVPTYNVAGTLVSCDPFVMTFDFWGGGLNYQWSGWHAYNTQSPFRPPPIASLTLVEMSPP